jgi:small-conductance mechanosensitive channel
MEAIMLSLSFRNPTQATTLPTPLAGQAAAAENTEPGVSPAIEQLRESVKVMLSQESQREAKTTDKNADIDASHLPDRVKDQLKLIRDLQQKIAKKMQQMQAFMSDHSLSPKAREAKIRQLQMEVMAMTNSLIQATNGLNRTMQEMKLSLSDRTLAGTLVSPQNLQS